MRRSNSLPGGLALLAMVGQAVPAQAPRGDDAVPPALADTLFGAAQRPRFEVVLGGARFRAIRTIGAHPALAWPVAAGGPAPARERDAVAAWLRAAGSSLGHGAFAPRFNGTSYRSGLEVQEFGFEHDGIVLLDHQLRVYWERDRFVGIANHFPAPITAIEPATAEDRAATNRVYFAQRSAGGFRMVLATLQRRSTATGVVTTVRIATGVAYRLHETRPTAITPLTAASFTEYPVPAGTRFPDQIQADARGLIWFSQPNDNLVTSFDPSTTRFTSYSTLPGRAPDGLAVDDRDRVWTGLFGSGLFGPGEMGVLDTQTAVFTRIPVPADYGPANLAIPTLSASGTIWVTDHINNKISEWDPVGRRWLQSLTMPTPECWVVQGVLDPTRSSIWFAESNANQLGVKPIGQPVSEVPVPSAGSPTFLTYHDDKVYYSLWSTNRLGEYDVGSGRFIEYAFQPGELGGPLAMAPDGKVVLGTRYAGNIVVFDPATQGITHYPIPTASPGLSAASRPQPNGPAEASSADPAPLGRASVLLESPGVPAVPTLARIFARRQHPRPGRLRDGLTVAQDGAIWFTESGKGKIARLVLR